MKKILIYVLFFLFLTNNSYTSNSNKFYEKIDLFSEVIEKVKKEYVDEVDQVEMMDSAINGLLQSLDPYSAYMTPESFKNMQTDTKGEFGGLGIEISMEAGVIKVIAPIANTPADKAGMKSGDYIVKIDNTQVQGKSLREAVKLMRGKVGTSTKLTVRRKGEKKAIEFNIEREVIEVKSVISKIIKLKENIGYIRLTSFNENSGEQFLKIIKEFEKNKNPSAYIVEIIRVDCYHKL